MYEVTEEELVSLKENAHRYCKEFLGGIWESISIEDFQLDIVQGGFSNKLYCCTLPENFTNNDRKHHDRIPRKVLMRIYGQIQSGQEVRLREITAFMLLSERNLGPKLYGLFSNGRLEEYIPSKSLKWNELPKLGVSIAKELAKIHVLEFPVRKTTLFPSQAYEWLEFAEEKIERTKLSPFFQTLLNGEFRREITWVLKEMKKINPPIVFCHNDLQGGNILKMDSAREDDRNLMFIDFEFGAYNYRAFDIANHFNARIFEFGVEDSAFFFHIHLDKFPTESEQVEFIDAYFDQLQKEGVEFQNDLQTEKNQLLHEIQLFRLAVLLHWTIGTFKFNSVSTHNLPYLDVLKDIWNIYETLKKEYIQKATQENEA